jgi:hypothetical protein
VCILPFLLLHNFFLVIVRNTSKGNQTEEAQKETVDVEKLSYAADAMQSVAQSFRNLTLRDITSDFKSTVSGTSKFISNPVILFLRYYNTANITWAKIPYILESNPHLFYSLRGIKNQMRIRFACGLDSRSRAGFLKND